MSWFLSKIVYQIICGEGDHTPQFDEQLRLIEADDEATAFTKARTIGELEQEMFFNQQQKNGAVEVYQCQRTLQIICTDGWGRIVFEGAGNRQCGSVYRACTQKSCPYPIEYLPSVYRTVLVILADLLN